MWQQLYMKGRAKGRASPTAFELTMHRALLVNDIVHTILQNVTLSTTDVINFASTCSALSFPALNILWCAQGNLGPLIMCLPQDTWEVGDDNLIHLSREPLPTEWERVRLNASRIRILRQLIRKPGGTHSKCPPRPHSRVLHRLFALFPPTSLFPNLHKLVFEAVSDLQEFSPDFLLLRQFLSPGLEELTFFLPSGIPVHEVEQLVDTLTAQASGLRQLLISAAYGVPCQLGLRLNKMQKLNLLAIPRNVCLTRQSVTDIGRLRSLQVLALTLNGESSILEDSRLGDTPLELNALKCLVLVARRLQPCTSFLLRVITPQLSSIDIKYVAYAAPAEVAEFVLSLHMPCQSFASLGEISVQRRSSHLHQDLDLDLRSPLPSHLFRPLLKFRRLTIVKFIAMGNYCLDDAFIEDAAVAWPDIRELWFASQETDTCTVTFSAMLSLASRCRSLRVLHLTFDATQRPTLPNSDDTPDGQQNFWIEQTALQRLYVGHSRVLKTSFAPFILAVVFPNLVDISSYQTPGTSDDITWQEVAEGLRRLKNFRERDPITIAQLPHVIQYMLKRNFPFHVTPIGM
ncbi:hypothetical protein DFH29DRAFT_1071624 [Suillus ampliporus]|nr:hypothetical protein DFH29DRAFT_1071624 [Suillus ampliporus]